jgi:hypothetical protein
LIDADSDFYDSAPTTSLDEPTAIHLPPNDPMNSIATLQLFATDTTALLIDFTEARSLIRTELNVKTRDVEQHVSELVDCAATLDFVSKDFVRRLSLPTPKSKVKTPCRLANGQRVTSSTIYEIKFE